MVHKFGNPDGAMADGAMGLATGVGGGVAGFSILMGTAKGTSSIMKGVSRKVAGRKKIKRKKRSK